MDPWKLVGLMGMSTAYGAVSIFPKAPHWAPQQWRRLVAAADQVKVRKDALIASLREREEQGGADRHEGRLRGQHVRINSERWLAREYEDTALYARQKGLVDDAAAAWAQYDIYIARAADLETGLPALQAALSGAAARDAKVAAAYAEAAAAYDEYERAYGEIRTALAALKDRAGVKVVAGDRTTFTLEALGPFADSVHERRAIEGAVCAHLGRQTEVLAVGAGEWSGEAITSPHYHARWNVSTEQPAVGW